MLDQHQIQNIWTHIVKTEANNLMQELQYKQLTLQGKTMRFQYFTFGERPPKGYSLIFGLHGGGGCPSQVNQRQFTNHKHLYDGYLPDGVIWFVPRSCEQAPDMWWKDYLQRFFGTIIRAFVLNDIVDSNKIFLTGYSAGGDGIYHLGPMFADWLAGAAMMAGHPNGVQLYNVRNISFSIQVGGQDSAYDRNAQARKYIQTMADLSQNFGGFKGIYNRIFEEQSHWMKKKDAQIFPFFLREERNPYPNNFLFKQHPRLQKKYFYYIQVQPQHHKQLLKVIKYDNTFVIEGQNMKIKIYVNRLMINFNSPVKIIHNNCITCMRLPQVNMQVIQHSIKERKDPYYIFQDVLLSDTTSYRPNSYLNNNPQAINIKQWPKFQQ